MPQPNPCILCVDDEAMPLALRKLVLVKHGFQVITAASAPDAMQAIERNHVDLVLADQLMPGGTGTELAKTVKQVRPDLPVALLSGVNEVPADAEFVDLFISKIEGPIAMCERISLLLSQHKNSSHE